MWIGFTSVIDRMRPHISRIEHAGAVDLRQQAAALALAAFGGDTVAQQPELINVAALTLLVQHHLVVHRLSSGAVRVIDDTDLHTLPGEPPVLLRGPWLLTSRAPERGEVLFGDTAELAGYPLDGTIYLIGLHYPDGVSVAPWRPHWREQEVEIDTGGSADLILRDVGEWRDWGRQAARFAVVLGLLLDAEGTPLLTEEPSEPRGRREGAGGRRTREVTWSTRRVYVDGRVYRLSSPAVGPGEERDMSHLQAARVMVSGYLRRQPYGPGGVLRKWVYVQSYEARRWVSPDRRVRVDVETLGGDR